MGHEGDEGGESGRGHEEELSNKSTVDGNSRRYAELSVASHSDNHGVKNVQ